MKHILLFSAACLPLITFAKQIPETHKVVDSHFTNTVGSLVTITQKDIKQSGATNISEVLQHTAGVQVSDSSTNSNAPSISMRGFGENAFANTLVLINGFPLENPDMANSYLNAIPLSEIKQIEVIPSSGGIIYGDDAVGGVINIITKQRKQFKANVFSQMGSYNQWLVGGSVGQTFKNGFNYYVQGQKTRNKGYRQNDTLRQSNLLTQLGYQYKTGSVLFHYQTVNLGQEFPGAVRTSSSPTANNSQQHANSKINIYSLRFNQQLKGTWRLESQLARRDTNTVGTLYSPFTQSRSITSFMPRFIGLLPYDNIMTIVGFEFRHNKYRYNMPTLASEDVNDNQNINSAYAHLKIPFAQHWFGTLGSRWAGNYNKLNGDNIVQRAFVTEQGLIFQPNQSWRFYLKRAGNFRFPKADETHTSSGVSQLKKQTGTSYELGATWQSNNILIQTSIYQLDVTNEIAYAPPKNDPTNFGTNRNLDPTRRRGIIIHTRFDLNRAWSVFADYSYVDAYMRSGPFSGKRIPYVAQNNAKLAANYKFLKNWNAYAAANYTGGRYPSEDNNNTDYFGGYTTYDASLQYQFHAWSLAFRINNITNKKYYSYSLFVPSNGVYVYPADGRNYVLTLGYAFS